MAFEERGHLCAVFTLLHIDWLPTSDCIARTRWGWQTEEACRTVGVAWLTAPPLNLPCDLGTKRWPGVWVWLVRTASRLLLLPGCTSCLCRGSPHKPNLLPLKPSQPSIHKIHIMTSSRTIRQTYHYYNLSFSWSLYPTKHRYGGKLCFAQGHLLFENDWDEITDPDWLKVHLSPEPHTCKHVFVPLFTSCDCSGRKIDCISGEFSDTWQTELQISCFYSV